MVLKVPMVTMNSFISHCIANCQQASMKASSRSYSSRWYWLWKRLFMPH